MIGLVNAKQEQFISAGYGLCYHYDAYNYSIRYKNIQTQAVIMSPARWRTMNMRPEQYVMLQYYSRGLYLGPGVRVNGGIVYSIGLKKKIINNLSSSISVYKDPDMTHIVLGLNIEI